MNENDLRSGKCPSCGHHEIIEAWPAEFAISRWENAFASTISLPLALSHLQINGQRDRDRPFGPLFTYTCRQCGLTQWVALKPAEVPIGPEYGTRLLVPGAPQGG